MDVEFARRQMIEQQVRAAGLNQITVTAGNWKPKTEDVGAAVAHQGDARDTLELPVPELMLEPEAGGDVLPARMGAQPGNDVVHAVGTLSTSWTAVRPASP